ncbi:inheritance of peroxisomes protein 1-domain-containing protein [Hypoxylon sp. FL0543]|nr:inheritance of peroxisomes protein 1-domain-containing protein [Hypoxylon sp. FL0543]
MADDNSKLAPGDGGMPPPRRVVTAPVDSLPLAPNSNAPSATSSRAEELVETLYSHPSVKIISFTSTQRASFGPRSPSDVDRPGTLPASSRLERTIAVGPFRIYRAPGSVAFLSCGSALQPILPKSQCWCIDEDNSRFVLQIRRPQYWRIELPVSEPDDKERALLLKDVLDRTLLFEKTHCPFQRSFTVEVPEELTPVKKKAWTPDGKNLISDPFSPVWSSPTPKGFGDHRRASLLADEIASLRVDVGSINERDESRYKRMQAEEHGEPVPAEGEDYSARYYDNLHNWQRADTMSAEEKAAYLAAQGARRPLRPAEYWARQGSVSEGPQTITEESPDNVDVKREEAIPQDPTVPDTRKEEEFGEEPSSFEGSGRVAPMNLKKKRMTRMLAGRAFTAPPQLSVKTAPPSKSKGLPAAAEPHPPPPPPPPPPSQPTQRKVSDESSHGSTDSFHSVQSWHSPITPLPPSPPSSRPVTPSRSQFPHPHENIVVPTQDNPAYTNTPSTDRTFVPNSAGLTDHADELSSPVTHFPPDNDERPADPIPIDESSKASRSTALEEAPPMRPRIRPNSLSISRRALSPLPSAANFFSPPQRPAAQSRMDAVRRLPSVIVQKTMEILLRPPTHLVNLMLKVAAKIAAGEWRGLVFGFGEGGERIPVQWDYADDDEFSDWSDDEDYAMARSKQSSSSNISQTTNGNKRDSRSWEVD